jgi:Abortive infection C-terminus
LCDNMLILYHGGGASDFELHDEPFNNEQWVSISQTTCRLLRARKLYQAADLLEKTPFGLFEATNGFGDEFCVLFGSMPFDSYLELSEKYKDATIQADALAISQALHETSSRYVRFIAVELNAHSAPEFVATLTLQVTSQAVERALADAEQLIRTRDAVSGVDRVHTAFHGYLRAVVSKMGMVADKDASATHLFKIIRENHKAFRRSATSDEEVNKILRAAANIVDSLGPIRNRASIAHPNEDLIEEPEAMLVINVVRSLLHYLDAKIGSGDE